MNSIVGFIQETTYDLTPTSSRLPSFLWVGFTALNKMHGLWRWYRRIEVYRKPDNLMQLLAGQTVNMILGDSFIIRIAAQSLLVATRLSECAKQQTILYQACIRWSEALKGKYVRPIDLKWAKQSGWGSPSSVYWWKHRFLTLIERIRKVMFCTFEICSEALKLSMCMMDVFDAFCWSPSTRQDAIGEGFVNMTTWLTMMTEQKEELLQGITNNKVIIEKLLEKSPFTYQQFHRTIETGLNKVEKVVHGVKTLSSLGGKKFIQQSKKAIHRGFFVMGLRSVL